MSSSFDWQAVLAKGPVARPSTFRSVSNYNPNTGEMGYYTDNGFEPFTAEDIAYREYLKALRFQESERQKQEAAQQYGVSENELRGTTSGWIPTDTSKIKPPPPDTSGFVTGGVPAGTKNMAELEVRSVARPMPAAGAQNQQPQQQQAMQLAMLMAMLGGGMNQQRMYQRSQPQAQNPMAIYAQGLARLLASQRPNTSAFMPAQQQVNPHAAFQASQQQKLQNNQLMMALRRALLGV